MVAFRNVIACVAVLMTMLNLSIAQLEEKDIPQDLKHLLKEDLDKWEPPEDFPKKFPYYLSGFDEDNRPIWVIELGKYDIKSVVEQGEAAAKNMSKYIDQTIYRVAKSIGERATPDAPQKECIIIYDMQGFSVDQLSSPQAIDFHVKTTRKNLSVVKFVNAVYLINVGFVARNFLRVVGPLYGPDFARAEIYGTNAAVWRPELLKKIPRSQLPEWYGGEKDFKPVRIYG